MDGQIPVTFNIKISSRSGQYEITTETKHHFIPENSFVIYDDFFTEDYVSKLVPKSHKIAINVCEQNKSLMKAEEIFQNMVIAKCNKETHLFAIGGGAIQDLATLVASLFMRGINWSYFPTTLMAMLDSCIGGKSSINVGNYKNVLGNIYPPSRIHISAKIIDTLPSVDIAAGLAEAGKICYAKSEHTFKEFLHVLKSETDKSLKYERLAEISLNAKKWFIEIDEFDKKERKLLNFGHTFGHAIEAASYFTIPHGIAILIGMKVALNFADRKIDELEVFIDETFDSIRSKIGRVNINRNQYLLAISNDKKHSSQEMFFILPDEDCRLSLVGFPKSNKLLDDCWQSLINSLIDLGAEFEVL